MAGNLYLCATPIGNLEDMTFRAVRVLKEVDLIAAEDTRNSIKLLNHFGISTKMTSYHEYNKYDKAAYLVEKILQGLDVALITDAGTPGISDPGEELVRQCLASGIRVTSLPGACACINALIISGLPTGRFCFEAFLPHDKKEREAVLQDLQNETRTIVLYEAPHRLRKTLALLGSVLGDRKISLCRELTKKYEERLSGTIEEMIAYHKDHEPRGEYVLVIEGRNRKEMLREGQKEWASMSLEDHMELYEKQGLERKAAMKEVAKDRGLTRRDVYQALLKK